MQLSRNKRNIVVAAAVFLACLLVFFVYWKLEVSDARTKSHSVYLNDAQQTTTQPLGPDVLVEQSFLSEAPFHTLGVAPMFAGSPPAGSLHLAVYNEQHHFLAEATGSADGAAAESYAVFVFEDVVQSATGQYQLEFTAALQDETVEYTLLKSETTLDDWTLRVAGQPVDGSLCLRISTNPIGSFLTAWYWVFAALGSLFAAAVCFFWQRGVRAHRLFALAAAGLGLLFCLVLPPYSAADEQFHINQTYNISSALLGETPSEIPWGTNYRRGADQSPVIEGQNTTVFTYQALVGGLFDGAHDDETVAYQGEEVGAPRWLHLPAALGVTLCRLLGIGFVGTLYAGRLVNLALYVLLATLAVKLAPRGRAAFAVIGLLPMSLHMAASYNRDGLTIGLFMLFTALCLRYALGGKQLDLPDYLLLAALAFVAGPIKGVYLPILLLLLLIPAKRFDWRGQAMTKRLARLTKAMLFAVAVVSAAGHIGGMVLANVTQAVPGSAAVLAAPISAFSAALPGPNATFAVPLWQATAANTVQTYTLMDFFRTPGVMLWLVVRTVFNQLLFWVQTAAGGNLGYYNTPLSEGFVIVYLLLLAAGALPAPEDTPLTSRARVAMLGMALASSGALILGCVMWTPVGDATIYGIQGRYFLPILPLALCMLGSKKTVIRPSRELTAPLTALCGVAGVFALLNTFLVILAR